ncbi:Digeranylgeranylglycerophospholipid reductase [uncultured archaeon]|nr:Digeranylgeranylglycerophospholipid reductase [uncultured archaeon]
MKYDVVVIGAGPAGATAAKFLAEKAINVLLLDKQVFPRDKPCGGGLQARVIKRYPYIKKNDLIDSYSFRLCFHSSSLKYKIDVLKSEPIIAMVLRNTFDEGLVHLASQNGAMFLEGKAAVSIKTNTDYVRVTLNDGTTIDASYVIAADGMWSTMTKQLGGTQKNQNIGMCVFEEYPVSKNIMDQFFSEQRCAHYYLNIFGIAGYGWVFPKKEHVNIGLCEFRHAITSDYQKKNLKTLYVQYVTLLKETKIIPKTLQVGTVKGGVFPTVPMERTYRARTVFCGDAGGLTNPLTGEGIYYAMASGEIASKVIINALNNGFALSQTLSVYQRWWMHDFGKDHKRYFRLSKGWRVDVENLVRLFEKDQKFIDLVLSVVMEPLSIKKIRWKVARHVLSVYIKNRLGLID